MSWLSDTTTLYHASPTAGLTVLQPSVTEFFGKSRQVCLTRLKAMALMYGIRHFEYTYGYGKAGKLFYEEYFPNALEELYRGKCASLYACSWREGMETTQIPNEVVSAVPVAVEKEVFIPDVWEALLDEERNGALEIVRWSSLSGQSREWIVRAEMREILEAGLLGQDSPRARYMREKYPESWALALNEMEDTQ